MPGWTDVTHKHCVHKLGNLCLLNRPDNSAVSNKSFTDKLAILKAGSLNGALITSLGTAFFLKNVTCCDEASLKARQAAMMRTLYIRWFHTDGKVPNKDVPTDLAEVAGGLHRYYKLENLLLHPHNYFDAQNNCMPGSRKLI